MGGWNTNKTSLKSSQLRTRDGGCIHLGSLSGYQPASLSWWCISSYWLFHPNSWYYQPSFPDEDTQAQRSGPICPRSWGWAKSLWLPRPPHYMAAQQLQRGSCPVLIPARGEAGYGKTPGLKGKVCFSSATSHLRGLGPVTSPFWACFLICQTGMRAPVLPLQSRAMHIQEVREEKHFQIRKLSTGRACHRCLQYVYQDICMHMHHSGTTLGHIQSWTITPQPIKLSLLNHRH